MKKLMLICALGVFGLTAVNAQQTTPPPTQQQQEQMGQEGTKIAPDQLPQQIKDAVSEHKDDKDARIVTAHQKTEAGELRYVVTFMKDDKTYTKTYDAQGNEVDKDKKRDD